MRKHKFFIPGLMILGLIVIVALAVFAYIGLPQPEYSPYQYGSDNREKLPRMTLLNHTQILHEVMGHPNLSVETIGILVYDDASTLETVGSMVVFSELMNVNIKYIGIETGIVPTNLIDLVVEYSIEDIDQLDVLIVPGGNSIGLQTALENDRLINWIQDIDRETTLTAGVGYGSLLLAEADLLHDTEIAFSWPLAEENTLAIGSRFTNERYTHDGKYWTSVGETGVLDMTLAMIEAIAGTNHLQGAMLDLEYNPAPPFDGGTAETTSPEILTTLLDTSYQYRSLTLLDHNSQPTTESTTNNEILQIGILVYDGFFTLDAIGPLAVLSQLNNAHVQLIRVGDSENIRSGRTTLIVPISISDIDMLDVLLIPGGSNGTWEMVQNDEVLDWIQLIDMSSQYTTSVCTGSWILGAAGLLQGRRATTNWYRASQMMEVFDAEFEPVRYTSDGKYWTSAGVSAGIDMSFALIAEIDGHIAAETAMMRLQYHPEPPIDAGTPEATSNLVLDMMHQMYDYQMVPLIRDYVN